MPRACSICDCADRELSAGGTIARIASRRGVSPDALKRHRTNHLLPVLRKALAEDVELAPVDPLEEVRTLYHKLNKNLDLAEAEPDNWQAVRAFYAEARKTLELLAKLMGELDERPQVNVYISAHVQQVILDAQRPYPEAGYAVADALGALEGKEAIGWSVPPATTRAGGTDQLRLALDPAQFFKYVAERQRRPIGEPLPYQRDVLRSTSKRIVLVAGRQCGKSSVLAARALHQALFVPGSLTLLVAPTERQSKILFAKVSRMYRAWGGHVDAVSARRLGLELENDSSVEALPGSPTTIQGYSADLLIIDEAGFVNDTLLDAATPSLAATDGTLILAGRPNGEWGPLYNTWTNATDYEKFRITAEECPLVSGEFLEHERSRMSVREYNAQYLCDFSAGSGRSLFGSREQIEAAFMRDVSPEQRAAFPSAPGDRDAGDRDAGDPDPGDRGPRERSRLTPTGYCPSWRA